MNIACSTCLDSFTSRSDISTTPCGHVFHTDCIEKWLENSQNPCPQCRKGCRKSQIIKLYFSEDESFSNYSLFAELEEANLKLQEEAKKSKANESETNQRCLILEEENLKLLKHLNDIKINSNNIEKKLRKKCEEVTERAINAEQEVNDIKSKLGNLKKQKPSNSNPEIPNRAKEHSLPAVDGFENFELLKKAIWNNEQETCRIILEKSHIKNPRNNSGWTALHEVTWNTGHTGIFRMIFNMMTSYEDKNPKDAQGWTPLHFAARQGHTEIAKMILAVVDDKNPKSDHGYTPLHEAASCGNKEIAEMILAVVEDKNPEDNDGWTPLSIAQFEYGHWQMTNLILSYVS